MCDPIKDYLTNKILKCILSKRGEKFGEYLDRYVILTNEYLHIYTDKLHTDYRGSYQLEFITTEFFNDEVSNNRLGIKFKYNKYAEDLLTKDKIVYNNLRKELRKLTIQVDLTTRYEIIEKIGEGNFGSVYKAENKETGEKVALKKYNAGELEKESNYFQKQCIMQEITMLKNVQQTYLLQGDELKIDNLINMYEVHEISNSIVLVMNLVEGGEFFDVVKNRDQFSWGESTTIMRQCLQGLAHLADINIAHRDIKPENLLFKYKDKPVIENQIVICDFGMATKCIMDKKLLLEKCGSPGYIAPEILEDGQSQKNLTPISDIFSMGVIFYILLTGTSPWKNNADTGGVLQQNKEAHIDCSVNNRFLREIDPDVRSILEYMLKKDPRQRISAKEALKTLDVIDQNRADRQLNKYGGGSTRNGLSNSLGVDFKTNRNKSVDPKGARSGKKVIINNINKEYYDNMREPKEKETAKDDMLLSLDYGQHTPKKTHARSRDQRTKQGTRTRDRNFSPYVGHGDPDEDVKTIKPKAKKNVADIVNRLYNSNNNKGRK